MRELIAYALLVALVLGLTGMLLMWRHNLPKNKRRRERRRQRDARETLQQLADRPS